MELASALRRYEDSESTGFAVHRCIRNETDNPSRAPRPEGGHVALNATDPLDVDRDPVAAGDDVTSHRERWTLDAGTTVDGVLLAPVRGYSRARVHGGASWLVELRCAGRTRPLAVVIDHDRSGERATEVLSLLPRVAGRPLVEVAAPRPGEQVEIYLRYLVNSRLQTPDQLAAERTVAGAEPRLVVKDD